MMKKLLYKIAGVTLLVVMLLNSQQASAQHTLTVSGGTGVSFARFYPNEETKMLWGAESFGLSWRYYSERPRFVGAVGIDLEYLERGFKYGYAYISELVEDGDDVREIRHYQFYTRRVNSLMLPFVWQPHVYLAKNRLRLYIEAAFVLSFNISSNYEYDKDRYPAGKYEWKVPRDNRFGYGLAGGLGFNVLLGQVELGLRARYHFGYSDLLKNRNKYYSNTTDGRENPFYYSPLRSPIDNVSVCLTVGWRFNKGGFKEWDVKPPKREGKLNEFNYSGSINAPLGSGGRGNSSNNRGGNQQNNRGGAMPPRR